MGQFNTLALFGEAEKGTFRTPHLLRSLPQVMESLGNPPPDSRGLFYAVQAFSMITISFFSSGGRGV